MAAVFTIFKLQKCYTSRWKAKILNFLKLTNFFENRSILRVVISAFLGGELCWDT